MNRGDYARVIHEHGQPAAPPREQGQRPGAGGPASRPAADGDSLRPGSATAPLRAITTGLTELGPEVSAAARPAAPAPARATPQAPAHSGETGYDAYGPGDPAYGPSVPAEPKRSGEAAAPAEDSDQAAGTAEPDLGVRGPFEPLRADQLDQAVSADEQAGPPGYPPAEAEPDDELDFGDPTDPGAGTLGDLRDLYLTAEAISPARLDRHFEQLLERQRRLISEYFAEPGPPGSAEPASPPAPLGFDTADSLAALRGELRSH